MVFFAICLLDSINLIQTIFRTSQMYAMMQDIERNNTTPMSTPHDVTSADTTVWWFARQELCKNFEGKKYFYKALKTKFCSVKLSFTAERVIDMCKKQDSILDKWVAELFDFDGDGLITYYEKTFYSDGYKKYKSL